MIGSDRFRLVKELEYAICILKKVEQEIIDMKDKKGTEKSAPKFEKAIGNNTE